MRNSRAIVERNPLVSFFVLAYGLPFSAFVILTVAYSILFSWVYIYTRGSVLISTLLHGSINLSQGFYLGGIAPAREYWLLAAVYGVAAFVLVVAAGPNLSRKPQVPSEVLEPGTQPRLLNSIYCNRTATRLIRARTRWTIHLPLNPEKPANKRILRTREDTSGQAGTA